jgi:hypothetical protein
VYGVPFNTDHLWKLQAVAEIPGAIDVNQLSNRYFRLTLVNDMTIDAAKKVFAILVCNIISTSPNINTAVFLYSSKVD